MHYLSNCEKLREDFNKGDCDPVQVLQKWNSMQKTGMELSVQWSDIADIQCAKPQPTNPYCLCSEKVITQNRDMTTWARSVSGADSYNLQIAAKSAKSAEDDIKVILLQEFKNVSTS